jgi:hypothetical protein
MSKYQQLVIARRSVDIAENRIDRYIGELFDADMKAAKQFQTRSAKDSVEGSVSLDVDLFTNKVREYAISVGDDEVGELPLIIIQRRVKARRVELFMDSNGFKRLMVALAKAEENKGLTAPSQGNA